MNKKKGSENMDKKELQNPALYTNRELSWLLFNKRVLSEARDKQLLLFERLKFLSITASNLDEFFMVRIGSLVDMIHAESVFPSDRHSVLLPAQPPVNPHYPG